MLYVIYGTDIKRARDKHTALVRVLQKKKPDAEVFVFDSDNWSDTEFESLIEAQGLFEKKYIVSLMRAFEYEIVRERLKELKQSENVFILFEEKLLAKDKKLLEKYSEKIEEHAEKVSKKQEAFNIFALCDAFLRKDKKRAWTLFHEALQSGVSPEEIHGILMWQIKTMCAVERSRGADEAGVKPFVYTKTKKALTQFKEGEGRRLLRRYFDLYQMSRTGDISLDLALEKELLK